MRRSRYPSARDALRWLTAFAFTVVGAVALIGNRIQAAGNDAVFTQSLVNRAARLGGTYYDNGITPKGPLEDVAHDIALRVGGYDGHFYVISIMVAISAVLLGLAAARTAQTTGGNRYVALAVGATVFVHFTFSNAAYAGLLYSRNILVTLLAVAWLLAIGDRGWMSSGRVQLTTAIVTGALLGLAVQTILPSIIDATAIGLAASFMIAKRVEDRARRRTLRRATAASAVVAFASAPAWYAVRGSFGPFWASWWTYASYQYRGIGLSFGQELSRGGNDFSGYYRHRPLLALAIGAFVVLTVSRWSRHDRTTRIVHASLLGWFAGGWFQLVSGERYSPHYFSVIAAPSAMIAAALAGHASAAIANRRWLGRTTAAWPVLAVVLSFALSSGTESRLVAASSTLSGFTSVHRAVQLARADQPGPNQSVQAVLDLVSRDRDPLLAYSDDQYLYPSYRRIPATRFQQRYFLIGSIYLGQTGPQYVLHDTWKWFDEDLRHANPVAFLKTVRIDSKPFAKYVASHFERVFDGNAGTVELRDDVAESVLRGATTTAWTPPSPPAAGSGWTIDRSSATYTRGSIPMRGDTLPLTTHACERISGELNGGADRPPSVAFHVLDPIGSRPEREVAFDGSYAIVEDSFGAPLDAIPTTPGATVPIPPVGPVSFSLVVGRRAAALVVGNRIISAVDIGEHVEVTLEPQRSGTAVTNLRVGRAPIGSGC